MGDGRTRRGLCLTATAMAMLASAGPAAGAPAALAPLATPGGFGVSGGDALRTTVVGTRVFALSSYGPVASYTLGPKALKGMVGTRSTTAFVSDGSTAFGMGDDGVLQSRALQPDGTLAAAVPVPYADGVSQTRGGLVGAVRSGADTIVFLRAGNVSLAALRVAGGAITQYVDLQTLSSGSEPFAVGTDAAGTIWVAVQTVFKPVRLVRLDPTTLLPVGKAATAPKSANLLGAWRLPCARQCRLVYLQAQNVGGSKGTIRSWAPGAPAASVGTGYVGGNGVASHLLASYDGAGRLWLAFENKDGKPFVRRGDARGAGGTARGFANPQRYLLGLQGVGGKVVVIAQKPVFGSRVLFSAVLSG